MEELKIAYERLRNLYIEEAGLKGDLKEEEDALRSTLAEEMGLYKRNGSPDKGKIKKTILKKAIEKIKENKNTLEADLEMMENIVEILNSIEENRVDRIEAIKNEMDDVKERIKSLKAEIKELAGGDDLFAEAIIEKAKNGDIRLPDAETVREIRSRLSRLLGE